MQFNRNIDNGNNTPDPEETFPEILQHFEGCLVVGYRKDSREKHVMMVAGDDACRDGLSFFIPTIEAWMQLGKIQNDDDDK